MTTIRDPASAEPLDWTLKGVPEALYGLRDDDVAARKLCIFEDAVTFPMATLRSAAIIANSAWMRAFTQAYGVTIAPHGKTTMAPALFEMQRRDGAWGITAATPHHVRAYRAFGVSRILMANQLVGDAAIQWVVDEINADPAFDFYCLVDSQANVAALSRIAARHARPLQVLVEVGQTGGRAGVRSLSEGLAVAEAAARAPGLSLRGVETFEGVFQTAADGQERAQRMVDLTVALARACDGAKLFDGEVLLTAGGSGFYDLAAQTLTAARLETRWRVVLRSGCYLTHDSDMYNRLYEALRGRSATPRDIGYDLQPALEVWGLVQSHPEPGRIIVGIGKRDVGLDAHPPTPLWRVPNARGPVMPIPAGWRVTAVNDQHAFLDGPDDDAPAIGDAIGFGISHPCTTFDKWRALLVVDDAWRVIRVLRTYF
jgi:D-serine dehydratase